MVDVCASSDVPIGEGRVATVGGRRIAVFRAASGWFALDDACPHRDGPLSDGILADACVVCPLHDRRFELESGASLSGDCDDVTAHHLEERDGRIYVELAGEEEQRASRAA